jgi:PAS domain S-box-containing protein
MPKRCGGGYLTEFNLVSNQERLRLIGGLTTAMNLFVGAILVILLPLTIETRLHIFYILGGLAGFMAIYYLTPALNSNKQLRIIPGLLYALGTVGTIYLSGRFGYLFMLFYLLLIAVGAFVYSTLEYVVFLSVVVVGVLMATLSPDLVIEAEYLVGIYMMLALAVVLRLFADNIFILEAEKSKYVKEIAELEADKGEIRNLLESLSDGLVVVDKENKITFINPAALKILSVVAPLERVLRRDVNNYLPTIGENGPEPITREVFEKLEHSIRNDFRIVAAEKTLRLHTNISPVINEHSNLKGAVILFRDITNIKKNEEQQAEFNAVASHELRTPLSIIEGYLFYVLDPSSKLKYDKETAEYIKRAHDAATELNSLVTDILTVVRAEEGELEVNLKKISPIPYLEKITHTFEDRATAKKIKLIFEVVAHEEPPEITTDPVKVREVLNNLIGNAIKFTEKGSVKVAVGLLKKELLVSITDTGIGISSADQSGIFNKFFRAENWKTRKTGGTGLGLYIAKTLVERLGGRIWVRSEKGQGSTFFFTLPLKVDPKQSGDNK